MATSSGDEPAPDCLACERLAAFRHLWREKESAWHNSPVRSFGDRSARLLIVGLAPGLRGANRTGRPFTGDYAGDLLYATLLKFGFARGEYRADPQDGLSLVEARITNAVRCVPPENKPTPAEIATCRPYLAATLQHMPQLAAVLALGRIAHDSVLKAFGQRLSAHGFAHGAMHRLGAITLYDSYHCSRYNTNTGRLTAAMFEAVFADIRRQLDSGA